MHAHTLRPGDITAHFFGVGGGGGKIWFSFNASKVMGHRGLNAGEKPCLGQGKAKQAHSCPEPAQGCPSSGDGASTGPQPSRPHAAGERCSLKSKQSVIFGTMKNCWPSHGGQCWRMGWQGARQRRSKG